MDDKQGRVFDSSEIDFDEWTPHDVMETYPQDLTEYLNNYLATIQDRDKKIEELQENRLAEALKQQNKILREGYRQVSNQNTVMREALERIEQLDGLGGSVTKLLNFAINAARQALEGDK